MSKDDPKPLENPEVEVGADPRDDRSYDDWDYAERVEEELKDRVERSLQEHESGGAGEQLGAARQHAKEAAKEVDGDKIREIKVHIREHDDDGKPSGDTEFTVEPEKRE